MTVTDALFCNEASRLNFFTAKTSVINDARVLTFSVQDSILKTRQSSAAKLENNASTRHESRKALQHMQMTMTHARVTA